MFPYMAKEIQGADAIKIANQTLRWDYPGLFGWDKSKLMSF